MEKFASVRIRYRMSRLLLLVAAALALPAESKESILMNGVETISSLAGLDTVAYLAKTVTSFMYIAQVVQEEGDGPRLPFLGDANERELLERIKMFLKKKISNSEVLKKKPQASKNSTSTPSASSDERNSILISESSSNILKSSPEETHRSLSIMVWDDLSRLEAVVKEIPKQTADAVRHNLRRDVRLELQLSEVARIVSRVDSADKRLQTYINNGWDPDNGQWSIERHTLEDMALSTVSHGAGSVRSSLDHLHNLVTKGSLLFDLVRSLQEMKSSTCSFQQSPQQVIYNLYSSVTVTELKGYAMMQFSWMLLKLYGKGNFTLEAELMQRAFEDQTQEKVAVVKAAMENSNRQLWKCDPDIYIEGENYVQLTKLLQGHIQNEVDMNPERACSENCGYYSYAKNPGCFDERVCHKMPRCAGRLYDCRYIDSDMWVCGDEQNTGRRYKGVRYENGRILGREGTCPNEFKVDSWWRWIFWHCSYCFCICDEQGSKSDRYFNLRPVIADTANNMVVTGLRFVKVNRVIHIQIKEGELLPRGAVNISSIRWRKVENYSTTDPNVKNDVDYKTLSWEQRAIDLDDLEGEDGHVLTGIRFRQLGTHLNFEIMVTPFNFTSGSLIRPHEQSRWISNDNTDASDKPRTQLHLRNPDVPTKTHQMSLPDSQSDQFIMFTHSDIDMDAAQTTVPFIDAQLVEPNPPILLSGAGIYHKGSTGYGGFIAPKVITYDYSKHMRAEFP